MNNDIKIIREDIMKLRKDIELLKSALLHDGKLSPWAKKALAKARAEKEEDYISISNI